MSHLTIFVEPAYEKYITKLEVNYGKICSKAFRYVNKGGHFCNLYWLSSHNRLSHHQVHLSAFFFVFDCWLQYTNLTSKC